MFRKRKSNMEATSAPSLLFRCCSSASVGRLHSGKFSLHAGGSPLGKESHSQLYGATPTALVSTTTNFLRVLHLAYKKLWEGESADQIELIFIVPGSETGVQLHCAKDRAEEIRWPKDRSRLFKHEFVYEWRIPEGAVAHRITMDTLLRRGLHLNQLCGLKDFKEFPGMIDFQNLTRTHWEQSCLFDIGYKAGTAACLFGLHSLTSRILDEILCLISYRNPFGLVEEGMEDALHAFASCIGDGLDAYEAELEDLSEAAAILDDEYATEVEEIVVDYSDQPADVNQALVVLEKRYGDRRAPLKTRLADIYLHIGY